MHPRGIVKLPRARIGLVVDPRRHLPELLKALEQSLLAGANDKSPIEVTLLYQLARIPTIGLPFVVGWRARERRPGCH
ncbi:MAG: hypothetical protein VST64_07305 [Nitrospirota bacterium]|nr:hypothetical protein [Nitrospirota bacterium]